MLQNLVLPRRQGEGKAFNFTYPEGLHKLIMMFTVLVLCFPSTEIPLFLGLFCKMLAVTENYGQNSARSFTLSARG